MEKYGRMRKNIRKEPNSMNKFVRECGHTKNSEDFLRAQDMLNPNTSQFPNMSRLSLRPQQKLAPIFQKENFVRGKRKQTKSTDEMEYLPVPLPKKPMLASRNKVVHSSQSNVKVQEPRMKLGRELVVITGTVEFVMKIFKLHPDLKALYEVYGNIMKMYKGKIRFEHIILMRSETGPVLQAFYFDFTDFLSKLYPASSIRCIGQFTRQNRFHIHKIEELPKPSRECNTFLSRIQNVSAFALQQAQMERQY